MAFLEPSLSEATRAAHRQNPVSRGQKKAKALTVLTGLRDEGKAWLDSRPEGYDAIDTNADKLSEVENFVEELDAIIDSLDALDIPDFRIRV